jgi:hypothetical protein
MQNFMPAPHLTDCSACINRDGPSDHRYQVPGGTLSYSPKRDACFPYLNAVPAHAFVHSPEYITKILVHVVDTSIDVRVAHAKFEKTISVPLGPNALMASHGSSRLFSFYLYITFPTDPHLGLFELEPGIIVFAQPLREDGIYKEEDDIVEGCCLDG